MKIPNDEFNKLRDEWYRRLEADGFKDVELKPDKNIRLIGKSIRARWHEVGQEEREEREDFFIGKSALTINYAGIKRAYFELLYAHANNEKVQFKNEMHKYILQRYAEGVRLCDIVKGLKHLGMQRDRKAVKFIIRKYEMEWQIKTYTPRQLGRRIRHTQL